MTAKWSVTKIVGDHLRTLVDDRKTRKPIRVRDILAFYGLPLLVLVLIIIPEFNFSWLAGVPGYRQLAAFRVNGLEGILSGISIYTALLFGLLVQIFQIKSRYLDNGEYSSDAMDLNDALEANVSYAVLTGIIATAYLALVLATTVKDNPAGRIPSGIIAFLVVHLLVTLFMILKRARSVYSHL
ncbi:hypothetical protein AB0383_29125 [Amycolatopsis sp. NPDC051373]|uniref:hypothetical protein n=1 Tax=Amycolatopsis sp. NPDC051373 TaxID=3155801 RepID=UPI0034500CAF